VIGPTIHTSIQINGDWCQTSRPNFSLFATVLTFYPLYNFGEGLVNCTSSSCEQASGILFDGYSRSSGR